MPASSGAFAPYLMPRDGMPFAADVESYDYDGPAAEAARSGHTPSRTARPRECEAAVADHCGAACDAWQASVRAAAAAHDDSVAVACRRNPRGGPDAKTAMQQLAGHLRWARACARTARRHADLAIQAERTFVRVTEATTPAEMAKAVDAAQRHALDAQLNLDRAEKSQDVAVDLLAGDSPQSGDGGGGGGGKPAAAEGKEVPRA